MFVLVSLCWLSPHLSAYRCSFELTKSYECLGDSLPSSPADSRPNRNATSHKLFSYCEGDVDVQNLFDEVREQVEELPLGCQRQKTIHAVHMWHTAIDDDTKALLVVKEEWWRDVEVKVGSRWSKEDS